MWVSPPPPSPVVCDITPLSNSSVTDNELVTVHEVFKQFSILKSPIDNSLSVVIWGLNRLIRVGRVGTVNTYSGTTIKPLIGGGFEELGSFDPVVG